MFELRPLSKSYAVVTKFFYDGRKMCPSPGVLGKKLLNMKLKTHKENSSEFKTFTRN